MTTVHHPPLKGIDFRHDHTWLFAGLLIALVVIVVMAVAWGLTNTDLTDDTFVASVEGTELNEEATVGHVQSPGITTQYFGYSGELYPTPVPLSSFPLSGFELDDEVTAGYHVQQPGVATQYFGYSGELYPMPMPLSGFELDHEVTTGYHVQQPGVTTQYFGNSGELLPEK